MTAKRKTRPKRSQPIPVTVSKAYKLNKAQSELDFVDVRLNRDNPLFVDPFALAHSPAPWSFECHRTIRAYFQEVVDLIREGDEQAARELLAHLGEPNETRLGLSRGRPEGAGVGPKQAKDLYDALTKSSAVRTGFLTSLEDCELMLPGISRDKISDLTTNVVRRHLAEYTADQCHLHDIPMEEGVGLPPYYDASESRWVSAYFRLPVWKGRPLLLVPKSAARRQPYFDHRQYYRRHVLVHLQAEHIAAGSSLVRTLKSGKRIVHKRSLEERPEYALSKEFLADFSKKNPEVLTKYRTAMARMVGTEERAGEDDASVAEGLAAALKAVPPGAKDATDFHDLMIGVVEFLFFPHLSYPVKETPIHQGRKRIDITMTNSATQGVFHSLHDIKKLPCQYVVLECKNYTGEVGNPELDQLSSRFGTNRGQLGFLCCRTFDDRRKFIERCRDTHKDGRGLILPIGDSWVLECLSLVEGGNRRALDAKVSQLVSEVWFS